MDQNIKLKIIQMLEAGESIVGVANTLHIPRHKVEQIYATDILGYAADPAVHAL